MTGLRIWDHPILGRLEDKSMVDIYVDGKQIPAIQGEPIAAALLAAGIAIFRYTPRLHEPRGLFCGIGQCTDCMMIVDGIPNVRTCITPVVSGMRIETQRGLGR
jgi:predicted molibdopterin-dependent oxidoreductase YjgC